MPIESDIPKPPEDLVLEGRKWARRQLMSEQGEEMEKALQGLFANGIEIFRVHQKGILDRIQKAGGVKDIAAPGFSSGFNSVVCEDESVIFASEILQTPVLSQEIPVPEGFSVIIPGDHIWEVGWANGAPEVARVTFPEKEEKVTQTYEINMVYGGRDIYYQGIEYLTGFGVNETGELHIDALRNCLDPHFYPTEIGIEELVTTHYQSWQDEARKLYSLNAKIWQPNLEGRAVGHTIANMVFTALGELRDEDGKLHRGMFSYITDHGHVAHGANIEETQAKLRRFYELLMFAHKTMVKGETVAKVEHPQISAGGK